MRRGDYVIANAPGELTGKPRPYVVVQSDLAIDDAPTITLCPVTTQLTHAEPVRIFVEPDAANGLEWPSEIAVDLVTTVRRRRIEKQIGFADVATMQRIDAALRRWLDL